MTLREGSDGLPVREVGAWTTEKLWYLERYVNIFTTAMKDKWDRLVYADLFSGPGRSVVVGTNEEIAGSPLIALGAPHPFDQLYFSDIDPVATDSLGARISSLGATNAIVKTAEVMSRQVV
jgi:three-Cys-motif partner protein